jgi:hypothetical protein
VEIFLSVDPNTEPLFIRYYFGIEMDNNQVFAPIGSRRFSDDLILKGQNGIG